MYITAIIIQKIKNNNYHGCPATKGGLYSGRAIIVDEIETGKKENLLLLD